MFIRFLINGTKEIELRDHNIVPLNEGDTVQVSGKEGAWVVPVSGDYVFLLTPEQFRFERLGPSA